MKIFESIILNKIYEIINKRKKDIKKALNLPCHKLIQAAAKK
jgi:hypothetical protein